jgi:uncharacterized protein YjdB
VASVQVSPAITSVKKGNKAQLTAAAYDASGRAVPNVSFTWTSSNGNVATVNGSGVVDAKRVGLVTITATANGKSGSSLVTVN